MSKDMRFPAFDPEEERLRHLRCKSVLVDHGEFQSTETEVDVQYLSRRLVLSTTHFVRSPSFQVHHLIAITLHLDRRLIVAFHNVTLH